MVGCKKCLFKLSIASLLCKFLVDTTQELKFSQHLLVVLSWNLQCNTFPSKWKHHQRYGVKTVKQKLPSGTFLQKFLRAHVSQPLMGANLFRFCSLYTDVKCQRFVNAKVISIDKCGQPSP